MEQKKIEEYIQTIKAEIAPALGCTEPAAVALCAAAAAQQLGCPTEELTIEVSEYIFKNAMNVGIPGVDAIGLDIASAMGAVCAQPDKGLMVLNGLSAEERAEAERLCKEGKVKVGINNDGGKVYVRAVAASGNEQGEAVIQAAHTNIVLLKKNGEIVLDRTAEFKENKTEEQPGTSADNSAKLSIAEIWDFIHEVPLEDILFLREVVRVNKEISEEGLSNPYGLQVGRTMMACSKVGLMNQDIGNYAIAATAAAADARMSGCEKMVISVAGSGNQGLTATVPVISVAEKTCKSEETLLRGLALTILTTIHAKEFIGRLSVLCGCSIASAIGVTAAVIYMCGGTLDQVGFGIRTMTADISGMVCDGAKPGCALKIATSVSAAMRAATLALSGIGATYHDGIVAKEVEDTLKNLGNLGLVGMADTNSTILDMLLHK